MLHFEHLFVVAFLALSIHASPQPVPGKSSPAVSRSQSQDIIQFAKFGGLFDSLFDYFYDDSQEESEENTQYLICRNCTVVVNQSQNGSPTPAQTSTTDSSSTTQSTQGSAGTTTTTPMSGADSPTTTAANGMGGDTTTVPPTEATPAPAEG